VARALESSASEEDSEEERRRDRIRKLREPAKKGRSNFLSNFV
jgi:hypothetical protein